MVKRDRLDQTAKTEVDRYSRYGTIKILPKESRMRQSYAKIGSPSPAIVTFPNTHQRNIFERT